MTPPLSLLDLALVGRDESVREALDGTVTLARAAERLGYTRVWYAEHHNMASIASSATAVLIAHVAAHTERIRLGAGGVMLPNHSPLVIAEQFGTLATLHPGRIDLGLGRAPGTDQQTLRALRRSPASADSFPHDVLELQGYLDDETVVPTVNAVPGRGTHVPLYILGSSLYGAQLAAALGLPYGFASHFAPEALHQAMAAYRAGFQPSARAAEPWAIAGVNVVVAETEEAAAEELLATRRSRVKRFLGRQLGNRHLSDEEADALLASPQGASVDSMMRYTAVGTPDQVRDQLDEFAAGCGADELMVVLQARTVDGRVHAAELLAGAAGQAPSAASTAATKASGSSTIG